MLLVGERQTVDGGCHLIEIERTGSGFRVIRERGLTQIGARDRSMPGTGIEVLRHEWWCPKCHKILSIDVARPRSEE